jgi:predicted ATPase
LYHSDFMAGFSLRDSLDFDDWQFAQSESLRNSLSLILENLARSYAERMEFENALKHARHWSSLDPLREEAHRILMMLYAWSGERTAALHQYRECLRILERELGVQPLDETTALYRAILEDRLQAPEGLSSTPASLIAVPSFSSASAISPTGGYPLVGRSGELAALNRAHAESRPDGRVTILEGEAGIGKTRLADDYLASARGRGTRIFRARCYEGETDLAYGPFLAGFQDLFDQPTSTDWLQAIPRQWLGEAARLFPNISTRFPDLPIAPPLEGPGAQVRFYEGLRQVLIAALAGDSPGILFLDDIHWSDSASLDYLAYLTRRLKGMPLFILLTTRTGLPENQSPEAYLFAESLRSSAGEKLHIDRLSSDEIRQMAASAPVGFTGSMESFGERLYQESEGLPLVAVHYLDFLTQGEGESGQVSWTTPSSLLEVLRSRFAGLGDVTGQLLGTAAVIGRSFDLDILRHASGRSEAETVTGVEDLIARRLIREQAEAENPGQVIFDFTHEKLRELAYHDTSRARRRLLHRRIAEVLSGQSHEPHPRGLRQDHSQTAVIANHYRLAGLDELAAHYYLLAGEHSRSIYANQEAIAHFESALASQHPSKSLIHEAIGDLQVFNGEYRQAIASYQTAAALSTPIDTTSLDSLPGGGEIDRLSDLEHKLGEVHHRLGEWELAENYFRAAITELADRGTPEVVSRLYADWSRTALSRGTIDEAERLAQEAMNLAEISQDKFALAQALNILGILARHKGGELELALQHLSRSLELAGNLPEPAARIAALNNLALVYADLDQFDLAIRLTQEALDLCVRLGDRHRQAALHNNLADLFHSTGQVDAGIDHLKQAVVIFTEIGGVGNLGSNEAHPNPEIWMLTDW